MLKINLSSFSKQTELTLKIKEDDVIFDKDISLNGQLILNLVLTKDTDNSVIVQGFINGSLNVNCVRCLEKFVYPVETNFTCIFKKKEMDEISDEKDGIYFYEKNEIDLFEYLRETLLLELPIKPICNENCKGLCPVCGKNLNKEKCNCRTDFKNKPFKDIKIK